MQIAPTGAESHYSCANWHGDFTFHCAGPAPQLAALFWLVSGVTL